MTVWGGSLNKKGTNYLRKIHDAEKAVKFLEAFKQLLEEKEKKVVNETINLIVDYINTLGENEKLEENDD